LDSHGFSSFLSIRPIDIRRQKSDPGNRQSDPEETVKKQLLNAWNDGNGTLAHYPKRSDYSLETAQNGASIAGGGGFDWVVTRPFALRILTVEYTHSWMNNVGPIHPQEGLEISAQAVVAVVRIGTW
jgi:hypothetical protein